MLVYAVRATLLVVVVVTRSVYPLGIAVQTTPKCARVKPGVTHHQSPVVPNVVVTPTACGTVTVAWIILSAVLLPHLLHRK